MAWVTCPVRFFTQPVDKTDHQEVDNNLSQESSGPPEPTMLRVSKQTGFIGQKVTPRKLQDRTVFKPTRKLMQRVGYQAVPSLIVSKSKPNATVAVAWSCATTVGPLKETVLVMGFPK